MKQLELTPQARKTDPVESHEAAASVKDPTAKQERVLALLKQIGPSTDNQMAWQYESRSLLDPDAWPRQSVSGLRTRRSELVRRGLVKKVGVTKLETGRNAAVWGVA